MKNDQNLIGSLNKREIRHCITALSTMIDHGFAVGDSHRINYVPIMETLTKLKRMQNRVD